MAKDKFKQMQQGGGFSFEDMVKQATTVAAIEKQADVQKTEQSSQAQQPAVQQQQVQTAQPSEVPRFMRLPNPQIPLTEYNLVSQYCNSFVNMTRQDFVELAIIEKLHNDGQMPDEEFNARYQEIKNRPPRGQRKGTKNQTSK